MSISLNHRTMKRILVSMGKDESDCVLLVAAPELVINGVLQNGPAWKLMSGRSGVEGLDERKLWIICKGIGTTQELLSCTLRGKCVQCARCE